MKKLLLVGGLPLVILLAGAGAFALMVSLRQPPRRLERSFRGPLVEAIPAPARKVRIVVEGQGTVSPSTEIDLVPQVAGTIVWKAPQLERGGYFSRGELLVRVDSSDYTLAVRRIEAEVAQARYRLEVEQGEAEVARREWELLEKESGGPGGAPPPLVLHIPQVRAAAADLEAAQARLEEARLQLERTRLYAPFEGRVREARLDQGQYVGVGQSLARLYSIEKAEIVVPVPDEDLAWFPLPRAPVAAPRTPGRTQVRNLQTEGRATGAEDAPEAVVKGWYAGRQHQWRGRVARAEGELDPRTRMAHLVVEVEAPYGAEGATAPLVVGMFVEVGIRGREVEGVRILPRAALHQGNVVWTVGAGNTLRIRPAQVVRAQDEEVLVRLEMEAGEKVVVSQLDGVTDGMKVRLATGETP